MAWYSRFAHHGWIDVRDDQGEWTRVEVLGAYSGVNFEAITEHEMLASHRWDRTVWTIATYEGEEAATIGPEVLRAAAACPDFGSRELQQIGENAFHSKYTPPERRDYRRFPGPNSNTFIAWLIDEIPELHAELHHNAVGKDFPYWFRFGTTSGGYGLEVETPVVGLGLGLQQGVELHLIGLTAGIDLWPPAIKLPLLPRLGWQDPNAGR